MEFTSKLSFSIISSTIHLHNIILNQVCLKSKNIVIISRTHAKQNKRTNYCSCYLYSNSVKCHAAPHHMFLLLLYICRGITSADLERLTRLQIATCCCRKEICTAISVIWISSQKICSLHGNRVRNLDQVTGLSPRIFSLCFENSIELYMLPQCNIGSNIPFTPKSGRSSEDNLLIYQN